MPELFLGLISGTSVDSIDAALVDFSAATPRLVHACSTAWTDELRDAIFATRKQGDQELGDLTQLDQHCAEAFASAALECLQQCGTDPAEVIAIGSHGQTIRHRPDAATPFSLQVGNGQRIAEICSIDTVSDFRTADIKAGGEGAPLVPAFHADVFRQPGIDRVIVNIGGVANITILPADIEQMVSGFDTGPGNNMMDAWCLQHKGESYDRGGAFAASGKTDASLLAACLMDEYFSRNPPKSTGFEYFNLDWLNSRIETQTAAEDIQSTLCDLTATSIIRDINRHASNTQQVFVCGGGAHNTELMQRMQKMTRASISTTADLGIDPDWVEAMTFAWLAKQHLAGSPGNLPSVTGASSEVILGSLTHA